MIYQGDNYHYCLECKCAINYGDIVTQGKWGYYCQQCSERENMPNIKITAEVDGKQVPLETVSTETFEAIKALEKPKVIPVARFAWYNGEEPRLLFKPAENIKFEIGKIYSLDLRRGMVASAWKLAEDEYAIKLTYPGDVKPL